MKYLFIASLTSLLLSCAGSDKIPPAAKAAFTKAFPDATHVDWDEEKDGSLEANFEQGGKKNSATFFTDGKIKETELETSEADLPAAVRQRIQKEYPNTPIKTAAVITDTAGKITYEVEINGKELFFDANGNPQQKPANEEQERD